MGYNPRGHKESDTNEQLHFHFHDGETMETVVDFIFLGSRITEDGDCSHEIKSACSLEEKL